LWQIAGHDDQWILQLAAGFGGDLKSIELVNAATNHQK
jgi:hypothetical protein